MELYPKRRAGLTGRWTPDGQALLVRDPRTGRQYRLPREGGRLLCCLDGRTPPGWDTGLSTGAVYRWLRLFACRGLLAEEDRRITAPGTLLWSCPCPRLARAVPRPLLRGWIGLQELFWLPLLAAAVLVCTRDIGRLPALEWETAGVLFWMVVGELPAMVLHELAHAAAANARGIPVSAFGAGVRLGLPCAFTSIPLLPLAPRRARRAVYRAGPLCNLCLGSVLLVLCRTVPLFRQEPVLWAAVSNFLLGGINLLPLEGLDGSGVMHTFPAADRALDGVTRRSGWSGFLERAVGRLLGSLFRVGLPVFLLYEGFCLVDLWKEVWPG